MARKVSLVPESIAPQDIAFQDIALQDIFVFLGPTLGVAEASAILPCRYLQPARCGDLLAYLRLGPKIIALIDGVFDRNASVWHKEILWALEQGVQVYGTSSMGALRAAELAEFGMQGMGAIFTAYQRGEYTDDDEVAVAHGSQHEGWRCFSEAMVNIRATVAKALAVGIIAPELADQLLRTAKQTFYPQRNLRRTIADVEAQGGDKPGLERLRAFLEQGGYVDQKRQDAEVLLEHLAKQVRGELPPPPESAVRLNKSMFIVELQGRLAVRPLPTGYPWLPVVERVCQQARWLGKSYWQARNLAGLLRWCQALADQRSLEPTAADFAAVDDSPLLGLARVAQTPGWAELQDLSPAGVESWRRQLAKIHALQRVSSGEGQPTKGQRAKFAAYLHLLWHLDFWHLDSPDKPPEVVSDPQLLYLYQQVAWLWALAVELEPPEPVALRASIIQTQEQLLLEPRDLWDATRWQQWLETYSAAPQAVAQPLPELIRLQGMVHGYRWWSRVGDTSPDSLPGLGGYLADALRLAGFYTSLRQQVIAEVSAAGESGIRQLTSGTAGLQRWCAERGLPIDSNPAQLAFWFDFSDPEEFLAALDTQAGNH